MSDQLSTLAILTGNLHTLLVRLGIGNLRQGSLQRLTGGASKETWAFDAVGPAGAIPLIMISEIGGWGEGSLGNWPLNPGRSAAGKGLAFSRS